MNICYAIVEIIEGVGQTTALSQIVPFNPSKYHSEIVTHRVKKYGSTLFENTEIFVSNSYYTSFLNMNLVNYFKKFDIIIIKSGMPFFLAALRSRIPTVYVLHQPDPIFLFSGKARINRSAARVLERPILLNRADAIISVSPWVAKWYKDHFDIDSVVIPDSFDLSVFKPEKKRVALSEHHPKLLCVGDWDGFNGRKRTHELIEMVTNFLKEYPDGQLSLVGLNQNHLSELSSFATKIGVVNGLRLVGKVDVDGLVNEYTSADIFVTATLVEGFYRPLIEAFACGVPAVVRDASNVYDPVCLSTLHHVHASGAGATYDGSAQSFLSAVENVLKNHNEYSRLGIDYSSRFDNNKLLPLYFKLFEDVLEKRQS